jgi:hypothetical protein
MRGAVKYLLHAKRPIEFFGKIIWEAKDALVTDQKTIPSLLVILVQGDQEPPDQQWPKNSIQARTKKMSVKTCIFLRNTDMLAACCPLTSVEI